MLLPTDRVRYVFLVLIALSGSEFTLSANVPVKQSELESLSAFLATVISGVKVSALHLLGVEQDIPIDQDVTFWCVPPRGEQLVQIRIDDSDIGAKLDMNRPVNFLVHGWLSGVFGGDKDLIEEKNRNPADGRMASTVTRWANAADCNVCAVDWSRLANYEYSIAALVNADKVADYLTAFVRSLRKLGLKVRDTKIAGHSLGAQIAGKVGRAFGGKLGAIHAMDAAGPGFTAPFDLGVGSRLSASDARYVECIQTAMDTLGTDLDCGHANFIMNDGEEQPGCSGSVICSHSRAYDYFHESLLEEYLLSGPKCVGHITNYISSIFGIECSNDYGYMGIHFKGQLGRFFVKTNAEAPFGKKIPVEEFRRIVTDVVDVPGQNEVEDVSDD